MPIPTTTLAGAIAAYGKAKSAETAASPGDGGEFADLVKGALQKAKEIGKTSEIRSVAAIKDEADLHQVVTAVAEAELTLQTVVSVRDKVIEAYREILRMPI